MKWPFVRRSTHEAILRDAAASEAAALKEARRCESALALAFSVTVDEVLVGECYTYTTTVSKRIFQKARIPQLIVADSLRRQLEAIIAKGLSDAGIPR